MIEVAVSPLDDHPTAGHPDPFHWEGLAVYGAHLVVTADVILVDGVTVAKRDRRAKVNRVPGHPWLWMHGREDALPITDVRVRVTVQPKGHDE